MGKGDKKTKRGKLVNGSYGKSRPKNKKAIANEAKPVEEKKTKTAAKPKKTKAKDDK